MLDRSEELKGHIKQFFLLLNYKKVDLLFLMKEREISFPLNEHTEFCILFLK
jgi:hypothetical protein